MNNHYAVNTCYSRRSNTASIHRRSGRRLTRAQRNLIHSLILSLLIICLILCFSYIIVKASDNRSSGQTLYRYYTSVSIQDKDTLWKLADEYNTGEESKTDYINHVMELNQMNDDTLYSGQELVIYYYTAEKK